MRCWQACLGPDGRNSADCSEEKTQNGSGVATSSYAWIGKAQTNRILAKRRKINYYYATNKDINIILKALTALYTARMPYYGITLTTRGESACFAGMFSLAGNAQAESSA